MNSSLYFLNAITKQFPDAQIELCYEKGNAWQLLVAVVLSAQTTDLAVNKVTSKLFKRFPDPASFAATTSQELEPYIKTLGFFRSKAKHLIQAGCVVMTRFGGQVPSVRSDLEKIPGVGPKSAAVIISNMFGQPAIAVDTHVSRVSRRMGLTKQADPSKIEAELTRLFPKKRLTEAHHALIWHGRRICHARKPQCEICPVVSRCPRVGL